MSDQVAHNVPRRRLLTTAALAGAAVAGAGVLASCTRPPRPETPGASGAQPTTSGTPVGGQDATEKYLRSLKFPKTSVPEPTSEVTLTIASTWVPSDLARQKIFDDYFTERHPKIKIVREVTPFAEFLQKYLTQLAGGKLPDILVCQFAWAQQFIGAKVYAPLDDYIAKSPEFDRQDITDVSISYYVVGGKTYCVPFDCGPICLFYNKDMFDKEGIKYPTADWTMEDLKAAAIKMTKGSGADKQWGLGSTPAPQAYWDPVYLQPFGGRYLNDAETECVMTSADSVKAAEWWMDLAVTKGGAPTQAEAAGLKGGAFLLGRAGMVVAGSWAATGFIEGAKFKWAVADMPKGPSTRSTAAVGSGFGITNSCPNKDAAWIYMNEYLSEAGISFMWASTGHGAPPRNKAWKAYLDSPVAPEGAIIFQKASGTYASSKGVVVKATTPKVDAASGPVWQQVVEKKIGAAEGCAKLKQAIDPILAVNK